MSYYNLHIKRLATHLLPLLYRQPLLLALHHAAVSGHAYIHNHFMQWKENIDYRLSHNGQVCYLQAALNDRFDPDFRRIRIADAPVLPPTILHQQDEGSAATLFGRRVNSPQALPVPPRTQGAIEVNSRNFGGRGVDFLVLLPALRGRVMIDCNTEYLAAIVNLYKLASKRWVLSTYNPMVGYAPTTDPNLNLLTDE